MKTTYVIACCLLLGASTAEAVSKVCAYHAAVSIARDTVRARDYPGSRAGNNAATIALGARFQWLGMGCAFIGTFLWTICDKPAIKHVNLLPGVMLIFYVLFYFVMV